MAFQPCSDYGNAIKDEKQPFVSEQPEADNEKHNSYESLFKLRRYFSWQVTVCAGVLVASFVFVVNISILIWLRHSYDQSGGTVTVLDGR